MSLVEPLRFGHEGIPESDSFAQWGPLEAPLNMTRACAQALQYHSRHFTQDTHEPGSTHRTAGSLEDFQRITYSRVYGERPIDRPSSPLGFQMSLLLFGINRGEMAALYNYSMTKGLSGSVELAEVMM